MSTTRGKPDIGLHCLPFFGSIKKSFVLLPSSPPRYDFPSYNYSSFGFLFPGGPLHIATMVSLLTPSPDGQPYRENADGEGFPSGKEVKRTNSQTLRLSAGTLLSGFLARVQNQDDDECDKRDTDADVGEIAGVVTFDAGPHLQKFLCAIAAVVHHAAACND